MKPADVAVQVAAEAVRSGDAESIADARVGLAALGVDDHSIHRQLALAAGLLEPKAALANTGEAGFVELMCEAWKRKQLATVAFGFAQLGIGVGEADLERITAAIAKVNGRRRTELISTAELVTVAIEVRRGAASARRPIDDRSWKKKETLRSCCALARQHDGSYLLELGTETVSSYVDARRLSTELSLPLKHVIPTARVEVPDEAPRLDSTNKLSQAVRERLSSALAGEPSIEAFQRAMEVLAELEPARADAEAAIALVHRHVSLWPDAARGTRWNFPPNRITPSLQPLFRTLSCGLGALSTHVELWPPDAPLFAALTELELISFDGPESALERFSSISRLSMKTITSMQLRFPPSLRWFSLASTWTEQALTSMVTLLVTHCPNLERVDLEPGKFTALDALPPTVQLGIDRASHSGSLDWLTTLGPERTFARINVHVQDETAAKLAPFAPRTRHLELTARPGQLEAVLRAGEWTALTGLTVALPAKWARMHRKKPPDYTFSRGDVEALTRAPFFSKLEVLDLTGILDETNSELLAAALVSARPPLKRLALNASECGNAFLEQVMAAGVLEHVEELELYRCKLKAKAFASFTEPKAPRQLKKLVLAKNAATQPALERFVTWPGLGSLQRLDLRELTLTPEQRALLESAPHVRREAVDLSASDFW